MKTFLCITLLAIVTFSCQKEPSPENIVATLPTLTTTAVTSITSTTAASGGNITDDGGAAITARGVCWSTASNPVIAGNHTVDGNGTGAFVATITGLTVSTIYYVRAYATNSEGTAYGNEITFTTTATAAVLPTISTIAISSITYITASGGGTITADGGASITLRGVCWSNSLNPVVTGNHTTDGNGIGSFTSVITGLSSGTVYYIRAYATNSVGTAYGNELMITTLSPDVYIAGIANNIVTNVATLWKNGTSTFLTNGPNSSHARNLFINGTDVYVAGSVSNGTKNIATYWKNGIATYLSNGIVNYYLNSIFVSGSDVYAVGYSDSLFSTGATLPYARYWKNGVLMNNITLPPSSSIFSAVLVLGGDVYISGSGFIASRFVATVWKNGVPTSVSNSTNNTSGTGLFINGLDIYVAGTEDGVSINNTARLWKNGTIINLLDPGGKSQANGVVVSNDSVYVTGSTFNGTRDVATIWKNGTPIYLQPQDVNRNSYATGIKILGNDVFVCGLEVNTGARFWKNGVGVTLANSVTSSQANSIFLK